MSDAEADSILRFWFEEHPRDWFVKNPIFDGEIRSRFLGPHDAAAAGQRVHWADGARSCLALVIVLDQFPRNMFRGEARAFATDAPARAEYALDGRLLWLEQHGWRIEYTSYEGARPKVLKLNYPGLELRLAISEWK